MNPSSRQATRYVLTRYVLTRFVLLAAAAYNFGWGAIVILWPATTLSFYGLSPQANIQLWQCIGMLVGAYGLAYWISAADPDRYWPFVFVGLIGKVLGPIGAVVAILRGELPARFFWLNVTNDVIWLVPFSIIVWRFWRRSRQ